MPATPKWSSPVQEHHIDFLLEEEFAADPAFLTFFPETTREHSHFLLASDFPAAAAESNCSSVRSVTTDKGETVGAAASSSRFPRLLCDSQKRVVLCQVIRRIERKLDRLTLGQNGRSSSASWPSLNCICQAYGRNESVSEHLRKGFSQ